MKLCVFLISYFMQGWAEDVAGMAYALRSLPEGAPCLPQVRASSGVSAPWGRRVEGMAGEGWGLCSTFGGPWGDSATESKTSCHECHLLRS